MSAFEEKVAVIDEACRAIASGEVSRAASVIERHYPFLPITATSRKYTLAQLLSVYMRDRFTCRYSGVRLVFPGTLRLLHKFLPNQFPFHPNWKTNACHFAFYELFPTVDHVVPVLRGGVDKEHNWVTTSMARNTAKANFTLDELGWSLHSPAERGWDGLMEWFIKEVQGNVALLDDSYISRWFAVATKRLPQTRSIA